MHCPPSFMGEQVHYNAPCLEGIIDVLSKKKGERDTWEGSTLPPLFVGVNKRRGGERSKRQGALTQALECFVYTPMPSKTTEF